jgi:hypothetical protein
MLHLLLKLVLAIEFIQNVKVRNHDFTNRIFSAVFWPKMRLKPLLRTQKPVLLVTASGALVQDRAICYNDRDVVTTV